MLEHNIERKYIYTWKMTTNIQAREVAEPTFLAEVSYAAHLFPNVREFCNGGNLWVSEPRGRERTKRLGAHSIGSNSEAGEAAAVKRLQAQKGRKNDHHRGQRCAKPLISRNRDKQTIQSQGQRPSGAPSRMITMPKMGPRKLLDEWPFWLCAHAISSSMPSVHCF